MPHAHAGAAHPAYQLTDRSAKPHYARRAQKLIWQILDRAWFSFLWASASRVLAAMVLAMLGNSRSKGSSARMPRVRTGPLNRFSSDGVSFRVSWPKGGCSLATVSYTHLTLPTKA